MVQTLVLQGRQASAKNKPDPNTHVVAIATERAILHERIAKRAYEMFETDVLSEARQLGKKYGWDSEAMTGNIYPILRQVIEGMMSEDQAIEQCVVRDRQLAKRQITWLKRHEFVKWLELDEARTYLEATLTTHATKKD